MVVGGVGVGDVAANGSEVAYQGVGDDPGGVREQGIALLDEGTLVQGGLPDHGADHQVAAILVQVVEAGDLVDVDEMGRCRQPEAHSGNEALATGQYLGVVPQFTEQSDGFAQALGGMVVEISWDQGLLLPGGVVEDFSEGCRGSEDGHRRGTEVPLCDLSSFRDEGC